MADFDDADIDPTATIPAGPVEDGGVRLKVQVLGPVRVYRDGASASLGTSRERLRTLFALLVVRADVGLSVNGIADELWEGSPPAGALTTIRVYATRLRRSLDVGTERSIILVENGVYRLSRACYETDVSEFERLVKLGEETIASAERCALLRLALQVSRGRPYAEVTQTPLILSEIARLDALRLRVVMDRIEADIDLGRHRSVIDELQTLVSAQPHHEHVWRMLVIALYRSGRQVEALRTAQAHRAHLRQEAGIEPSRRLIGLEHAILVRDPELDWHPPHERRSKTRLQSVSSPCSETRMALVQGRQLLSDGQFAEAGSVFVSAVSATHEPTDGPGRELACDIMLGLAEARLNCRDLAGTRSAAIAAADLARDAGSASRLAMAAAWASSQNIVGRPDEALEALCREALDSLPLAASDLRARVLAALADYQCFAVGDGDAALVTAAEALELANESCDPTVIARCLFQSGEALDWTARVAERTLHGERLVSHGLAHGDIEAECEGLHLRALARLALGDLDGFDSDRLRLDRLASEVLNWHRHVFLRVWRGMRAMMSGRFDDVEPAVAGLFALASHEPNIQNLAFGQLLFLRREQGRLAELRPMVEQHVTQEPQIATLSCALAWVLAETGQIDKASRQLLAHVDGAVVRAPHDLTWTTSLCLLAETAVAVGNSEAADAILRELLPYRGQVAVLSKGVAVTGAIDRYIGLLQALIGDEAAGSSFDAALRLDTSLCAPPLVARTKVCLGRWLCQRPRATDRRRGKTLLAEGHRAAVELAMPGLAAGAELQGV